MTSATETESPRGLAAWLAEFRAQAVILRICLEERLVYRGDFALGTLMRFLPIVTQIFLWWAVFHSLPTQSSGDIRGYRYESMVAYYLLTMVGRAFSSMPGLSSGIARDIRDGTIKKYLIQPIDMLTFLFWSRVAHKLVYYMVAAGPFALVFFLCRDFFTQMPDALTWAAFLTSLVLAFLLGFFLESTLGLLGFWLMEVSSLLFIYMLFNFFFSGHMFPIDILPDPWRTLVELLPLQYLAYFPAAVFLQHLPPDQIARGLLVQFGWVVFFIVANRVLYHYGLKRYSAYGG